MEIYYKVRVTCENGLNLLLVFEFATRNQAETKAGHLMANYPSIKCSVEKFARNRIDF